MHYEIRIHGRGGQGAKTAAGLIAETALDEGRFIQAFPEYGPERSGAPVKTYVKISDKKILSYSAIKHAEIVLVIDESLIDEKVVENLADSCVMVINTDKNIKGKLTELGFKGYTYCVDATKIALEELGKNIPNIALIGALIKASDEKIIKLEGLNKKIKEVLSSKGDKIVEGNLRAARRAYEQVKKC
jgi:pyruvate ferredoxin oxidoreductase gamma subunit